MNSIFISRSVDLTTFIIPNAFIYKNIEAQIIDDTKGITLVSSSSTQLKLENGGNCEAAAKVGSDLAAKAKAKGIEIVAFDRGGYLYHGRVAALADAAREGGLKF